MPKDRKDCSVSNDSCGGSPFSRCSSRVRLRSSPKNLKECEENVKEWEDARCPVCLEHPHNAVLLLCSSHDKGCRPFMCDTSYRHSNCLDKFRKSFSEASVLVSHQVEAVAEPATDLVGTFTPNTEAANGNLTVKVGSNSDNGSPSDNQTKSKLVCPLCRGKITGWIVVEPARHFMNAKHRSCACETCEFGGTYSDLRKHARVTHPLVRPSDADPERQRIWRRLERQRDIGDLFSTLQTSIEDERDEDSTLPIDDEGWLTVLLLIRVLQPESTTRSSSSSRSGNSRARSQHARRRLTRLWGEIDDILEITTPSSADDENESEGSWSRQTRRRATPDEEQ